MKIFRKNITERRPNRILARLLFILSATILISGCLEKDNTPEFIFKEFLKAIKNNDRDKALSHVLPQEKLSSLESPWFEKMKLDTLKSNPRFVRIDWIRRGYEAKLVYTYDDQRMEDYLIMVFDKNKWWIRLADEYHNLNEIPSFTPSNSTIK